MLKQLIFTLSLENQGLMKGGALRWEYWGLVRKLLLKKEQVIPKNREAGKQDETN